MSLAGISPEQMAAASQPPMACGRGILTAETAALATYGVVTMAEPWEFAESRLSGRPAFVYHVTSMDRQEVERAEQALPPVPVVVGIGGGSALDMGKYLAWKRGIRLVTVPSIVSVDAAVTNTIAVREGHRVRYMGFVIPDRVVVDFDLIGQAPPHLNRAGIGDILSIHTALWDWQAAARAGLAQMNPQVAAGAAALVDRLEQETAAIKEVSDAGLKFIMEAYVKENALCLQAGTAQPEEGSEHFWAYNVEYLTGRHFIHGELIALGIYLMAHLQGNDPDRVRRVLADSGVRYHPAQIGLSREELVRSLTTLRDYTEAEGLPHSVIQERPVTDGYLAQTVQDFGL